MKRPFSRLRSGLGRRGWGLLLDRAYPLLDATGA
jgi:hypothetical protein